MVVNEKKHEPSFPSFLKPSNASGILGINISSQMCEDGQPETCPQQMKALVGNAY